MLFFSRVDFLFQLVKPLNHVLMLLLHLQQLELKLFVLVDLLFVILVYFLQLLVDLGVFHLDAF